MAYHILTVKKDLGHYMTKLENGIIPHASTNCFAGFECFYKRIADQGLSVYVGLLLDRSASKLIKDFNERFSNIKILIKFKKKFTKYTNAEQMANEYIISPHTEIIKRVDVYVFNIKFSKNYEGRTKFFIYPSLAQFIRVYSPMNRYVPHYRMASEAKPTVTSILEGHGKYGRASDYGSWNWLAPTLEEFMLLDDPDFMNRAVRGLDTYNFYASNLFREIRTQLREEINHDHN